MHSLFVCDVGFGPTLTISDWTSKQCFLSTCRSIILLAGLSLSRWAFYALNIPIPIYLRLTKFPENIMNLHSPVNFDVRILICITSIHSQPTWIAGVYPWYFSVLSRAWLWQDGWKNIRHSCSALEEWCRRAVVGYHGLVITNMSSSWSDGRTFCAILHRYRPDLLDYMSLDHNDWEGWVKGGI